MALAERATAALVAPGKLGGTGGIGSGVGLGDGGDHGGKGRAGGPVVPAQAVPVAHRTRFRVESAPPHFRTAP
ncbi:MAG: hypothetical protein H6717_37605 [Polyangiaceae bacterium]|nr:hypothetical protein [Polyangiaceae bacterium]